MGNRDTIAQGAVDRIGCGYVYGATGAYCTVSYREARQKQYPASAALIKANCMRMAGQASACDGINKKTKKPCPWFDTPAKRGRKLYDCAQLTRACAKLAGFILPSGATSQYKADIWEAKGTISTLPEDRRGLMLYWDDGKGKKKHTAVAIGGDDLVEARGHSYGVVRGKISQRKPTHWCRLRGIAGQSTAPAPAPAPEPAPVPPTTRPTLRRGDKGPEVAELQQLLAATVVDVAGKQILADGIFGPITQTAARIFQGTHGLAVDGIVGPLTWRTLLAVTGRT